MLSYAESGSFILLALAISVVTVLLLNRVWPIPNRKLINDVTGWQLGILGTTYGVILGFMLYTVWNDFRTAEVNTNLEAVSLLTVSRIAKGLPSPEREAFHALGNQVIIAGRRKEVLEQTVAANAGMKSVAG